MQGRDSPPDVPPPPRPTSLNSQPGTGKTNSHKRKGLDPGTGRSRDETSAASLRGFCRLGGRVVTMVHNQAAVAETLTSLHSLSLSLSLLLLSFFCLFSSFGLFFFFFF